MLGFECGKGVLPVSIEGSGKSLCLNLSIFVHGELDHVIGAEHPLYGNLDICHLKDQIHFVICLSAMYWSGWG